MVLAAHTATYLPFPIAGLAGELALAALGEQSKETAMIAAGLGLLPAGKLLGPVYSRVGKFIGHAESAAWGAAKHYAGKAGRYLARMHPGGGNVGRAAAWRKRKQLVPGTCGCFAAATMVWASGGLVPIEQLELGDEVLAFNEATGAAELREVTDVIITHSAALLLLNVEHADGRTETIRTTDEHPFWVLNADACEGSSLATRGRWVRADQLSSGDALDTLTGPAYVTSLAFTQERQTVYNLTVEGLHTFRVGDDGVLVHNCQLVVLEKLPSNMIIRRPKARGRAPIGTDGKMIELHHPDSSDPMAVKEMLYTVHRGKGNSRANHPDPWPGMTAEDRVLYNNERRKYWEKQWDSGRFDGLPD